MTKEQIFLCGVFKDFTGLIRTLSDDEIMRNRKLPSRTKRLQKIFIDMATRHKLDDWLESIKGPEGNTYG